jgi:hypothetical protein
VEDGSSFLNSLVLKKLIKRKERKEIKERISQYPMDTLISSSSIDIAPIIKDGSIFETKKEDIDLNIVLIL